MIQAAVSAQEHMESEQLILACLLHDIGHLLEKDDMGGLGVKNHGTVGKQYLEKIGMKLGEYTSDYNVILKPHLWTYFLDIFGRFLNVKT